MSIEARRDELEKGLRRSRRALPIEAALGAVAVAVIAGLHAWLAFPAWIAWSLGALAVVGAVGDAVNIALCKRELRRLDRDT